MKDSKPPENPHFVKGCLGLAALGLFSIASAAALIYAAQWVIGF